eukprot:2393093-Rhodomonas_salina.1
MLPVAKVRPRRVGTASQASSIVMPHPIHHIPVITVVQITVIIHSDTSVLRDTCDPARRHRATRSTAPH